MSHLTCTPAGHDEWSHHLQTITLTSDDRLLVVAPVACSLTWASTTGAASRHFPGNVQMLFRWSCATLPDMPSEHAYPLMTCQNVESG